MESESSSTSRPSTSAEAPRASVGVVAICGARELRRALEALAGQEGCELFETVVVADPQLAGLPAVVEAFPGVRLVANEGQRTPLELAGRAVRETSGDVVLLTEDHCVPDPGWVAALLAALAPGRAAAGGCVAVASGATALDWAFYFVDYFRYAEPLAEGPSPSLTVCNVAYRRRDLDQIAETWRELFHETAVNEALGRRFGQLWLTPRARVTVHRHPTLRDALYERYAFGRLYGGTRLGFVSRARALAYTVLAPALPVLLLGRMAKKALPSAALRRPFLRALGHLTLLVLAWTWGEWLGYLTRRRPRDLTVAPSRHWLRGERHAE